MRTDIRREIFTSSEAGSVSFAIGRSVRSRMACLASRLMRCRISVVDTPAPLSSRRDPLVDLRVVDLRLGLDDYSDWSSRFDQRR